MTSANETTPEASRAMLRRDLRSAAARTARPAHPHAPRTAAKGRTWGRAIMGGLAALAVIGLATAYLTPLGSVIAAPASAEVTPQVTLYASALGDAQTVEISSLEPASATALNRDAYTVYVKPKPTPTPKPQPASVRSRAGSFTVPFVAPNPGTAQAIAYDIVKARGWSDGEFACLVSLWKRESGWRVNAYNPSGAYGIPQALPGSKMASAGADWATNPATQIKWGLGYISGRYGTPCGAWSHSQSYSWY
ncbi:hypothetical protein GCM10022240_25590 [Microbacterium kribbense]|uniref:Transglycosylase SLT domain-containing protein n=1 Tax=Microbacterium kribbense TaxID=433645 RepID=A0ABP7GSM0_9MICO